MKNQAFVFQRAYSTAVTMIGVFIAMVALMAISAMATITSFTTATTTNWIAPANVFSVQVECWGGGGAGGGCATSPTNTCAGGGSGGSYVRSTVAVTPGVSYRIIVGAGGTGSTGTGGVGGSSSFAITNSGTTTVALAVGGRGGVGNTNVTSGTLTNRTGGVAGGVGTTSGNIVFVNGNSLNIAGTNGGASVGGATNGVAHSGAGGAAAGSSAIAGGAGAAAITASSSGVSGGTGSAPGGGGSGAVNTTGSVIGGSGGIGWVIVTYSTAPFVITASAINISTTAATLSGTVTADNGTFIIDRGFYWKTSSGVTKTDNQLSEGGTNVSSFVATLAGLAPNTTYYYRAYASNSIGTTLGSELNFITAPNDPTAPTVNNPGWGSLDVTIGAGDGNLPTTVYAIQETTTGEYVQADGTLGAVAVYRTIDWWNPTGAPVTVSGLASTTTYVFQVKAHNLTSNDTGYSPSASGTTAPSAAPVVISQIASAAAVNGGRLNGKITGDGNSGITERGFYWKSAPGVTTTDTKAVEGGTAVSSFFADLSGLSVNTPYYYRAYAVNSVGMTLGAEMTLWTLANRPFSPLVNSPATNTLNVTLVSGDGDGNPPGTAYAIEEMYTETFVQADGSLAASPVYQTMSTWNPAGVPIKVSGLTPSATYIFEVKARNGANVDTALSAPASGTCSALANGSTPNVAPSVTVLSATQRPGTTFMDIDFQVDDPDNAVVQVAALGFVNGGANFSDIVKVSTLAEGTSTNLGTNVIANTPLHLTWNVAADWNTNFGNVQVEILAKDNRGLLPFHWITLPANGTNSHLTMSDRSYGNADFLPAWYWLIATNDAGLVLSNGIVYGATSPFSGVQLAIGTSTTSFGRLFIGSRAGFTPVNQQQVNRALAGPYGNQSFFQGVDLSSVAKGYSPSTVKVVYGWGLNTSGQLNFPSDVNFRDVRAAALGSAYTLLLTSNTVVGLGNNSSGQISVPTSATNVVAIAAGSSHGVALRGDGTVVAWGNNSSGQTNIPPTATNVVSIAAGSSHCLALRADGTVVGWGLTTSGQVAIPNSATSVTSIAAGSSHSIALRSDGNVIVWGLGSSGQTNVPPAATNVIAIASGSSHCLALRSDRTVVAWGNNANGQTNVPPSVTNVVAISAGSSHSLALCGDGSVISWGLGSSGQTNVPVNVSSVTFLGVGSGASHCVAVSAFNP
ncbi:MAG: glycine-rich domain-containing protein [Limisphaerales bacterium]